MGLRRLLEFFSPRGRDRVPPGDLRLALVYSPGVAFDNRRDSAADGRLLARMMDVFFASDDPRFGEALQHRLRMANKGNSSARLVALGLCALRLSEFEPIARDLNLDVRLLAQAYGHWLQNRPIPGPGLFGSSGRSRWPTKVAEAWGGLREGIETLADPPAGALEILRGNWGDLESETAVADELKRLLGPHSRLIGDFEEAVRRWSRQGKEPSSVKRGKPMNLGRNGRPRGAHPKSSNTNVEVWFKTRVLGMSASDRFVYGALLENPETASEDEIRKAVASARRRASDVQKDLDRIAERLPAKG